MDEKHGACPMKTFPLSQLSLC